MVALIVLFRVVVSCGLAAVVSAHFNTALLPPSAVVLLKDAMGMFEQGRMKESLVMFKTIVSRYPDIIDGYVNAGIIAEHVGDLGYAKKVYLKGIKRMPKVHKSPMNANSGPNFLHANLCRLLARQKLARMEKHPKYETREQLSDMQQLVNGWGIENPKTMPDLKYQMDTLWDVNHPDATLMVEQCTAAAHYARDDHDSWATLGRVHILLGNYTGAMTAFEECERIIAEMDQYALETIEMKTTNDKALDALYGKLFMRRRGNETAIMEALYYRKLAFKVLPTARSMHNIITISLDIRQFDPEIAILADKMVRMRIREINEVSPSAPRSIAKTWDEIATRIEVLELPQHMYQGVSAGEIYRVANRTTEYHKLSFGDLIPMAFRERQLIGITIDNCQMEGPSGVMFTNTKLFLGTHANMPSDYTGESDPEQMVKYVPGTTVTIDPANKINWYHWSTEGLSGLALTLIFYPGLRILLPDNNFARDAVDVFDIDPDMVIWYDTKSPQRENPGKQRYHFQRLIRVDWRDMPGMEIVGPCHDPWRIYQPTATGMRLARNRVLSQLDNDRPVGPKVIYVSRADTFYVRMVIDEDHLVHALHEVIGRNCMHVYIARYKNETSNDRTPTLLSQAGLFADAHMVIGPHGAGLSNLLFAREGASLVYFPTRPMVDNCFANVAAAVNATMHPVSEMSAFNYGPYTVDQAKIDAVVKVVEEVIAARGWTRGNVCAGEATAPPVELPHLEL